MTWLPLAVLAVAVLMTAFAAALTTGARHDSRRPRDTRPLNHR